MGTYGEEEGFNIPVYKTKIFLFILEMLYALSVIMLYTFSSYVTAGDQTAIPNPSASSDLKS